MTKWKKFNDLFRRLGNTEVGRFNYRCLQELIFKHIMSKLEQRILSRMGQ